MSFLCWYTGLSDSKNIKRLGLEYIPPASLRYRTNGSLDIYNYLQIGKKQSEFIESELSNIGRELGLFQNILDFGCGCGRTLIWLTDNTSASRFYGTDIDIESISWCKNNLNFATFSVNKALPPLEYSEETFDLTYAISVFTHLNEDYQYRWLDELRRVIRPKGVLLITVHGEHCWKDLPKKDINEIKEKGFLFITSNAMKGIFPAWYQNAYHTEKYISDKYSKYFEILKYIPRGLDSYQDLVILQKP